jgi:Kef-type K+ transport system membrane component KefB
MRNFKNSLFYIFVTGGFIYLMYRIVEQGKLLEIGKNIILPSSSDSQWSQFLKSLLHNIKEPLALLLLQIITIVIIARIFGWIFRKIGQPSVIGEIIAGIVLGPSLFGLYFPDFKEALFPDDSLGNLKMISQVGLILFMFVIGMELDLKALKNKANEAVVISHASIVIPFALGIGLSYYMYQNPSFIETLNSVTGQLEYKIPFLSFALFMGIAMSITAFPVLARIVQERGIHKTRLGTIVITCAAADDITAWCILAAVIAIVKAGSFVSSFYVIALAIIYVVGMLFVVKPFLKRIGELYGKKDNLKKSVVAIFFLILIISSYVTEAIGIHALFGAFMTGAIMPDIAKFRNAFIEKVEDIAVLLFLPLFFVFTGLKTNIGLLNDDYLWQITGLIIAVAVVGKFFGSALAAKFVGQNWRESLTIGALMNTRGLMELVVLNIGRELGVLNDTVFTMMVIMALVTTFMTGPALDIINFIFKTKDVIIPSEVKSNSDYNILISFGNNQKGISLLKLANSLIKNHTTNANITAMHLTISDEMHAFNIEEYEKVAFDPIVTESKKLNQQITTIFKASNDIETDIADIALQGKYDLLLVGIGKSIFEGTILGKVLGFTSRIINPDRLLDKFKGKEGLFENSPFDDRTRLIISKTKTPLGIFIDKDLKHIDKIFVGIYSVGDVFLIDYAQKFIFNNNSHITILDSKDLTKKNFIVANALEGLEKNYSDNIKVNQIDMLDKSFLSQQDLIIFSLETWKIIVDEEASWLSDIPSVLIIRP